MFGTGEANVPAVADSPIPISLQLVPGDPSWSHDPVKQESVQIQKSTGETSKKKTKAVRAASL